MYKNVTLEMSLKPFKQTDDAYIHEVCRNFFEQWRPLLKNRETVSVMLWTADGSEILDYAGNLEQTFDWCCFIGTANLPLLGEGEDPDVNLHKRKRYYMENSPEMTYGILKKIVAAIHEEGAKAFPGSVIRVGETFDIGPEFARSAFKYERHTEISSGSRLDAFGFVDATALLNGDDRSYAAYPGGIPQDTPFGTFLGKQSRIFLTDMGFDYIWLSNGLGFSADPWSFTGKVFDGKDFHPEKLENTREKVFAFWKLFREACPDFPIETRGTNNSVGIDYATDGVALYDIYNAGLNITPPPNSPWAALNDNFGLELMGHMTRICELPGQEFLFRYYIHDPWWVNSPWYDRYNGSAHDIYLPMAVTRVREDGSVQSAGSLNVLSIDNSFGDMPDCCVNEPLPHLLKAEKDMADSPAPIVWVYPMREYTTSHSEEWLREMYYGDKFIADAINDGFPLNCVVSTDIFLKTPLEVYKASVLLSPVPENGAVLEKLNAFAQSGGHVIFYGSREKGAAQLGQHTFADIADAPAALRQKLAECGYTIAFEKKAKDAGSPVLTLARKDNGLLLSAYNRNQTSETLFRFPLGAPILTGTDAEIREGSAVYHFSRCDHKECRVFVEQASGVVSLTERAPVSDLYHRLLRLSGLEDATVCVFPEDRGELLAAFGQRVGDEKPVYDDRWIRVEDEKWGVYYKAEHLTGCCDIMLPYKTTADSPYIRSRHR